MRTSASPSEPGALRVRFSASRGALERLLRDEIAGEPPGAVERSLFRDLYFDTPEGELERRGAFARVRVEPEGGAALEVELDGTTDPGARRLREPLPEAAFDPAALFSGDTPAARLLRALVDPARLAPWLEVGTDRQVRHAGRGGAIRIVCDVLTLRQDGIGASLHEVEAILPDGVKGRKKMLRALEADYDLAPVAGTLPVRARRALAEEGIDWLEEAVRAARRVAVVAFHDGCLALRQEGRGLRVAAGEGSGEEAARRVLREHWEQGGARIRLLGVAPGSPQRPATEVWVAEGMSGPLAARDGEEVVSVPLGELLETVGSPALRDDATLAALHVLARTDLAVEPGSGPPASLRTAPPAPAPPGDPGEPLPAGALLNMELSALAFNRRVLALAADPATPIMERVRFLAIFGANLDEFFRVRVAGFKRQVAEGSAKRTLDGATPEAQLDAIGVRARRLAEAAGRLLTGDLLPELARHGVEVVRPRDLGEEDRRWLDEFYEISVHAVLTPLTAGPGHPFPHIRNLRPALACILREPETDAERLGVVELPDGLPRFVRLPDGRRFVALEAVIAAHLPRLYPGALVQVDAVFRVTRSAELHLRGRTDEDLLFAVQEEVAQRRFRPVVRLEVEESMPARLRDLLLRELQFEAAERASALADADVYPVPWPVDLRGVRDLAVLDGPGLTYPAPEPAAPLPADRPVLEAVGEREWLLSFPRDSFEATVERFVLEAADDPEVLAIKLALYRTNRRSRIVEALCRASARGKQVVALVELTARFDEAENIAWAQYLRRHGIHVVYGPPDTKVHAKIALVVRREGGGVRRYAYLGTGNLNAQTARAYTDLGLLTADETLTADLAEVFNFLTGAGSRVETRELLVAPFTLREGFLRRIRREAEHARAGRGGHLRVKVNGLADREVVAALYEASAAGVRVELIVRSLCVLRPRVPGLSENIRVVSVLGRYLEHARVYRFANGGDPEYLIGSADWRTRNLSRRVEVVTPVRAAEHRAVLDELLDDQWNAPDAWELGPDGTYYQRPDLPPALSAAGPGGER